MRRIFSKALFLAALAAMFVYFYYSLPDVSVLKRSNPRTSALMQLRDGEYRQKGIRGPRRQVWLPYGAISEHLKKAVLVSEDASFFSHQGVDLVELKEALKKDLETGSFKRGASTITMQLARNLYLNPSKNPLRKIKEIIIARQLEHALSKRRIFEIYLNIVEWGRNIYGAEAASLYYFGKSAGRLEVLEAATLAALLPSPRSAPQKGVLYRRNLILNRLAAVGYIDGEEYNRLKSARLFQKIEQEEPFIPVTD
jgi:monofunctional biosynthetic peptidoglycan transglycosylase